MPVVSANAVIVQTKRLLMRRSILAALVVGSVLVMYIGTAVRAPGSGLGALDWGDDRVQLRQQVETSAGSPADGRDPAVQQQTGLAAVASLPHGTGQRVDKPAVGVTGETKPADAGHAHHALQQPGVLASGCLADYGIPGEQCLPASVVRAGEITCSDVRRHFSSGVKVSGNDRYQIDGNNNGTACDSQD